MLKKTIPLAITATLCSMPAFAAMPLVTDDTGTQGKGRLQIEFGWESHRDKSVSDGVTSRETGGSSTATVSYGISDSIDLVAGMPWAWKRSETDGEAATDEHGIADLPVQLKWRLVEMEEGKFSLALKPGLILPTGNEGKGLGNGRVSGGVLLIATHRGALGATHVNLGYTRNGYSLESVRSATRADIWHASLAGELNVADSLRAVADIGIETGKAKGSPADPAYLLGGLIYSPSDRLDLDFGIKGALNDVETDTALFAGATLHF
ncbi:MAG: transporter [Chlorobiaceae bacterium]|nr:transporter [Chlorobiaceae bacterium]